jgi:hypothetical protein
VLVRIDQTVYRHTDQIGTAVTSSMHSGDIISAFPPTSCPAQDASRREIVALSRQEQP